jgi:hypothetical protein
MLDPYQHDDFSAVPFYESHSFHKDEASGSHILKRSDSFFDPRGRERDDAEDLFVSARSKGFPPQK